MDGSKDGLLRHDNSHSAKLEVRDEQHATVTIAERGVLEAGAFATRTSDLVSVGHSAGASLLEHQDDESITNGEYFEIQNCFQKHGIK